MATRHRESLDHVLESELRRLLRHRPKPDPVTGKTDPPITTDQRLKALNIGVRLAAVKRGLAGADESGTGSGFADDDD